jgi:ribose transport system permease protein
MSLEAGGNKLSRERITEGIKSRLMYSRSIQLFLITIIVMLVSSLLLGPRFANSRNAQAIMISFVSTGLVSIGMMALLISGIFDLSVGSIYAIGMITVAYGMRTLGLFWPLAALFALLICAACGLVNGFLVTKMRINPLIATLAMMGILRGFAIIIGGVGVSGFPDSFKMIGQSNFLGLRIPVWIFFIVAIIFHLLFRHFKFFRKFYFVGGNPEAARLCGINVNQIWTSGFVITSLLSGLAGILFAARLGSSTGQAGIGMELQIIAGVVIGGASLKGGKGTIFGGIVGAFFMTIVFNIMLISGVSAYWQRIVNGVILILAVYTDVVVEEGYFKTMFKKKKHWT